VLNLSLQIQHSRRTGLAAKLLVLEVNTEERKKKERTKRKEQKNEFFRTSHLLKIKQKTTKHGEKK
jgi:hypothetical protein